MVGVDLSEHNGYVDFDKLKTEVDFVILRIGWIGNKQNHTIDKRFFEYYKEAKRVGLDIGFYVYSYCVDPARTVEGAIWTYNIISDLEFTKPVFIDLEDSSIKNLNRETLTASAQVFCEYFKNFGIMAGIYASKDWFLNKLNINKLLDYKIWLAEWNGKNSHTLGFKVDLWQYTNKGNLQAIKGNVDMNMCFCEDKQISQKIENEPKVVESGVKMYKNGGTLETVYCDTNLTNKIGVLNKNEVCECLGIYKDRAIVRYKVDKKENYKIGFVQWLGGVQNE